MMSFMYTMTMMTSNSMSKSMISSMTYSMSSTMTMDIPMPMPPMSKPMTNMMKLRSSLSDRFVKGRFLDPNHRSNTTTKLCRMTIYCQANSQNADQSLDILHDGLLI